MLSSAGIVRRAAAGTVDDGVEVVTGEATGEATEGAIHGIVGGPSDVEGSDKGSVVLEQRR